MTHRPLDLWDMALICGGLPAALMAIALLIDLGAEWMGAHGWECAFCELMKMVGVL